ncbi:endogenous retrovirus group K, member 6 [Gossypium arboreum]|uniref:Endogenous retrovirus group K, member 6 n=1 Tax=Gossypium arboreum TaxID=29729 RepID=A0A0B0NNN8_GOSAR|nr:endogenous retrovirus group K, member 6 [Gossypium arboreum]
MSTRATSVASVGNDRRDRTECKFCGKWHSGSCRFHDHSCYRCGSSDHFVKDCPRLSKQNVNQSGKPSTATARGRPPRNTGNASGGQRGSRDATTRSEARAPTRAYAIRAREDASSPDVITDTFTLFDTDVIALIDPSSTHSYEKLKEKKAEYEAIASTDSSVNLENIDNRIITEVLGPERYGRKYVPSGSQAQAEVQRLRGQIAEMQASTVEQIAEVERKYEELQQQLRADATAKEAEAVAMAAEHSKKYDELQLQLQYMMQMF